MDPLYAFLIFVLLVALDFLAQQRWLAAYYRFGLPVSFWKTPVAIRKTSKNGASPSTGFTLETAGVLQERFRARPTHPSIHFHPLANGAMAFREQLFENRGGFKYLPVMHSTARLHPDRGQVAVTGNINLWVIFTLAYMAYRAAIEPGFVPVALLALLVLVISYATQAGINRQVALAISETVVGSVMTAAGSGKGEA